MPTLCLRPLHFRYPVGRLLSPLQSLARAKRVYETREAPRPAFNATAGYVAALQSSLGHNALQHQHCKVHCYIAQVMGKIDDLNTPIIFRPSHLTVCNKLYTFKNAFLGILIFLEWVLKI